MILVGEGKNTWYKSNILSASCVLPDPVRPTTMTMVGVEILCLTYIGRIGKRQRAHLLPNHDQGEVDWIRSRHFEHHVAPKLRTVTNIPTFITYNLPPLFSLLFNFSTTLKVSKKVCFYLIHQPLLHDGVVSSWYSVCWLPSSHQACKVWDNGN